MSRGARIAVASVAFVAAATFAFPRSEPVVEQAGAPAGPVADSLPVAVSQATLESWLAASSFDAPDTAALRSLHCAPDADPSYPAPLLADYRVLDGAGRAGAVRAEVVTVGEVDRDRRSRGRFVARLRERTDTLEWDIVRHAGDATRLVVCDGIGFATAVDDSSTEWRPATASMAMARALADSVRGRRGGR